MKGSRILLVDPDDRRAARIADFLEHHQFRVTTCPDGELARKSLEKQRFNLLVTNRHAHGIDGFELLRLVRRRYPATAVILLTECGSVADAVEAFKLGAQDYLTTPFHEDALLFKVRNVLEHRHLKSENVHLQSQLAVVRPPGDLIGQSESMQKVYELVHAVAPMDVTVLIYGESGTGKGMTARAIHDHSSRKDGPFVKVSCSIFVPTLLESELFGHEKGAFTGAIYARIGRFEQARGGTIFLDDIDDLSLDIQTKLLRVLQEGDIERVGGNRSLPVNVRVIVASKRSLKELIDEKIFRADLFYRINVVPIHLPPLRERLDDIPLLVAHFLHLYRRQYSCAASATVPDSIMDHFMAYSWPGNVRELENTIKRLTVLCQGGALAVDDLPPEIRSCRPGAIAGNHASTWGELPLKDFLEAMEHDFIRDALERHGWRIEETAQSLQISRKCLWEKMRRHNISKSVTHG